MLANTMRFVEEKPERIEMTEAERELLDGVRERMERYDTPLYELVSETGTDRRVVSAMLRNGLEVDEDMALLSKWERDKTCEKLAAWAERMDAEEVCIEQVERRMASIHTIYSLAKLLKINPMHLGLLLSRQKESKPGGTMDKSRILKTLDDWLESDPEMDRSIGMAKTPTSMKIRQAYELAMTTCLMVYIVADFGIGKTNTAEAFWRENPKTFRNPGVVYVSFNSTDTSERAVLGRIVEALYAQGLIATRNGDPMTIITEALGADDLLLMDEAHFIFNEGSRGSNALHNLSNIKPLPTVLQGNFTLKDTIWNDKKQTHGALANRSLRMKDMQTTNEDVTAWMEWAGYGGNERLITAAQKVIVRPGQSGGLRTLAIIMSVFEKTRTCENLTVDKFKELAKHLGKAWQ